MADVRLLTGYSDVPNTVRTDTISLSEKTDLVLSMPKRTPEYHLSVSQNEYYSGGYFFENRILKLHYNLSKYL